MPQQRTPASDAIAADILASMQEAVVFADLEGIIRSWNRGAEAVFGFAADDAIGQSVDIIVPEKMRRAHWEGYNKAIALGDTYSGRGARLTRALHLTGQTLYVDMSFAMVRDGAGLLTGSIAVARDATARYLAERAAKNVVAAPAPAASAPPAA